MKESGIRAGTVSLVHILILILTVPRVSRLPSLAASCNARTVLTYVRIALLLLPLLYSCLAYPRA